LSKENALSQADIFCDYMVQDLLDSPKKEEPEKKQLNFQIQRQESLGSLQPPLSAKGNSSFNFEDSDEQKPTSHRVMQQEKEKKGSGNSNKGGSKSILKISKNKIEQYNPSIPTNMLSGIMSKNIEENSPTFGAQTGTYYHMVTHPAS